jgi:hypothetical protein
MSHSMVRGMAVEHTALGDNTMERQFTTITDVYQYFTECFGTESPARTLDELRDLIHAAGLRYEEIDSRFWDLAFGDVESTFVASWAHGQVDWPTDAQWDAFAARG